MIVKGDFVLCLTDRGHYKSKRNDQPSDQRCRASECVNKIQMQNSFGVLTSGFINACYLFIKVACRFVKEA